MRWATATHHGGGGLSLRELLMGPPMAPPLASGTLMRYATLLEARGLSSARELAALAEDDLCGLGLKPFHARRLRRWAAQLDDDGADGADEAPVREEEIDEAAAEEIEAMDVGELKRALDERGIPYHDCVEKQDLRNRLQRGVSVPEERQQRTEEERGRTALVPATGEIAERGGGGGGGGSERQQGQGGGSGFGSRGSLRSERSDDSSMEEFLTPGATALAVRSAPSSLLFCGCSLPPHVCPEPVLAKRSCFDQKN